MAKKLNETFLRILGGMRHGLVATDPAGRGRVIPYTTSGDVVLGDGTIGDVPLTALPAHASTHQNGGSDEISVAGLSGLLADGQSPLAHQASHNNGGSDPLKLDDLATPDDNTDLNASTTRHGLLRKLDNDPTHFLDGQGSWSTPPATSAEDIRDAGFYRPLVNGDTVTPGFIFNDDGETIAVWTTGA